MRDPGSSSSTGGSSLPDFPWFQEPRVVATHGNSILVRFVLLSPSEPAGSSLHDEFFVFQIKTPHGGCILTRLPACGHGFINHDARNNIGILCRGTDDDYRDQFVAAHLTIPSQQRRRPVVADLCMANPWRSWRIDGLPIRHVDPRQELDLFWWETDTVLPFGDSICWVDYLRGILFCDNIFSTKLPQLCYVPLPVDPFECSRDVKMGARGAMYAHRSVCATRDRYGAAIIKFVDVASSRLWYSRNLPTPLTINSWTLSSDRLSWTKDGTIEAAEFYALTSHLNLPPIRPIVPLVDIKDSQTIYFALRDLSWSKENAILIAVNMFTKNLLHSVPCTLRRSLSMAEDSSGTSSRNLFFYEPFRPLEFSKVPGSGFA